jgi:hypothetical protein
MKKIYMIIIFILLSRSVLFVFLKYALGLDAFKSMDISIFISSLLLLYLILFDKDTQIINEIKFISIK